MRTVRCDYCGAVANESTEANPNGWYNVIDDNIDLDFCKSQCLASWAVMIYESQTKGKKEELEQATPW